MKRLLLLALILAPAFAWAQNLQLHYDFGKDRKYLTTTVEMFKTDEYGATYFFIDMDYNNSGNKSVSLSYWEIARYITLPIADNKLSATVQYNDGHAGLIPLGQVWLGGLSYPIDLGFITVTTDLLYRGQHGMESNAQLTFFWYKPYFENIIAFTGFIDIWTYDKLSGSGKNLAFLAEPQIWLNVWNHLNVGGELEISKNFIPGKNDIQINPTLGLKWTF